MQSNVISWIRGYVRLQIRGNRGEELLNEMMLQKLHIWDIKVSEEKKYELKLHIKDFFKLRPLLRRTGCRAHVLERFGFPFLLDKLSSRKVFVAGFIGFMLGLYLLSSLVWKVSVEGNEKLADSDILQAAYKQGIHRFQWKLRLQDEAVLSKQIQLLLPGTSWVGVEIRGTHVKIKVVEATIPEPGKLMNPRSLIASKNALVTEITAEKGKVMVKPNSYVRKGDVLISGIIGDEEFQQTVVASGKVKGIVWYTSTIESPLTRSYKVYTGESRTKNYLVLGSRALQLTGYGSDSYEQSEVIPDRKTLQWRKFSLPIGWLHEKVMEARLEERSVDPLEAKAVGLEQARAELLLAAGSDSRIVGEKILHEKTENGKVYMEVYFEVEEWIMEEQPIVTQGE
jgi:similar to stage IV sporulation protein